MLIRYVGGSVDGLENEWPDDGPLPLWIPPPEGVLDDPGVYVLDPDRTYGPSAEALNLHIIADRGDEDEEDDDWYDRPDDYWDQRDKAWRELESHQRIARTYKDGHHVVFYKHVDTTADIPLRLNGTYVQPEYEAYEP